MSAQLLEPDLSVHLAMDGDLAALTEGLVTAGFGALERTLASVDVGVFAVVLLRGKSF